MPIVSSVMPSLPPRPARAAAGLPRSSRTRASAAAASARLFACGGRSGSPNRTSASTTPVRGQPQHVDEEAFAAEPGHHVQVLDRHRRAVELEVAHRRRHHRRPASTAAWKIPLRKGSSAPASVEVPSGKPSTVAPAASAAATCATPRAPARLSCRLMKIVPPEAASAPNNGQRRMSWRAANTTGKSPPIVTTSA